jgi:DNA-binding NtrC family response regulator
MRNVSAALRESRSPRRRGAATGLDEISVLYVSSASGSAPASKLLRSDASVTFAADAAEAVNLLGSAEYEVVLVDLATAGANSIGMTDLLAHPSRVPVVGVLDRGAVLRGTAGVSLRGAREQFEREFIGRALVQHNGRVGEAARALGIQRTNLYRKVRQLKLPKTLIARQK